MGVRYRLFMARFVALHRSGISEPAEMAAKDVGAKIAPPVSCTTSKKAGADGDIWASVLGRVGAIRLDHVALDQSLVLNGFCRMGDLDFVRMHKLNAE